ncbi:DUF6327 family protein [Arenimonas sp. GDDSR-1]|uniref:DUF6327 family protein n=1 Tax=Arenimonas sp. GDDSR-1 TaxID=2950125 RepID=UPI00262F9F6A|nr:DUF6327 family protein [Arenimonas sp. GDDSR-1]
MTRKTYSSFEQIDQELEILALEKELRQIQLRQAAGKAAEALKPGNLLMESLGPVGGMVRNSGAVQKVLMMWLARRLLK